MILLDGILGLDGSVRLDLSLKRNNSHASGQARHVCQTGSTYLERDSHGIIDLNHRITPPLGILYLGKRACGVSLQCRCCVARVIYDIVPETKIESRL